MMRAPIIFRSGMRIICAALALTLAPVALDDGVTLNTAYAQEAGEQRRGGILRFLFPRQEKQQRPTAPPVQQKKPPAQRRARAPAPPPPPPEIEKAEDARRILVIGDFLAGSLADGLAAAYAEDANMLVLDRANGSSGLVRDDYYDWPGNVAAILDAEKPAAVIVMIGANDRQQLRVGNASEPPGSEAWLGEYEHRAKALATAVRERNLPLLWVSALPFKSSVMSSDMVAFNDLYRRIVTSAGGEFIDVWHGFVDESGSFVANGPDMNGQPAQLRGSDGIAVTRPGRRKIAFYVEKPLARLLGLDGADGMAALPSGPDSDTSPDALDPAAADRTQPIAIDDLDAEPESALLGAVVIPASREISLPAGLPAGPPPDGELARDDSRVDTHPGRADDFSFRAPAPEASSDAASSDATGNQK